MGTKQCGRFSYLVQKKKYNEKCVAPAYLDLESAQNRKSTKEEDLFKGCMINKEGEFKLVDENVLKNYKGLISTMMKKIAQSVAEGRGMVGVSLPVRIFEARSTIERITDCWGYLEQYISTNTISSPVSMDQYVTNMKQVVKFAVSGLSLSVNMMKPFNPLLGETYQGEFRDGSKLDIEHISHHPPVSVFMISNGSFKFNGHYEYIAKTSSTFNQITLIYKGPNIFSFGEQKIEYNMPEVKMGGMIWGDRLICFKKNMVFIDRVNKIKAVLVFGVSYVKGKLKKNNANSLYGKIYRYNDKKIKSDEDIEKMIDMEQELHTISGSYVKQLLIDDQEVWNISKDQARLVRPIINPLPSDWRFREDLIWLHHNQQNQSETWKLELEAEQRRMKKLRQTK